MDQMIDVVAYHHKCFLIFIPMLWIKFPMRYKSLNEPTSYDLWKRAEAATSVKH